MKVIDRNLLTIGITSLVLGLLYLVYISKAFGVQPEPYKIICHHNPSNDVTLSFLNEQAYTGHLGTPHNTQVYDTDGPCSDVSIVPTEGITPTDGVTPTSEATPSATPANKEHVSDGRSDGLSSCPSCTKAPNIVPAAPPATGRSR